MSALEVVVLAVVILAGAAGAWSLHRSRRPTEAHSGARTMLVLTGALALAIVLRGTL